MFLQTLVQLNLLILATPALTGWALLPLAQPGLVRACVVSPGRAVEAVAPKATSVGAVQTLRAAPAQPAVRPSPAATGALIDQAVDFVAGASPTVVSSHPFPHAARAP